MECHCALDEKSFLGSKYRCFHSGFVRGHHWSCCGATDETAAGCLTSPLLTSIISLFPDSGALHRGMMKCKCNHVIDRLTSPLDKDRHHLANTCLWECCNASWEVSLCTTSSTVSSLKAQVSLITNFDKMLVSGVGDFTPCCSNEHPMVKLSKAEFSLQSKNSLHEEGNDSDDDDDEVNIKDRSNGLKVTCDICNKVDISDESHLLLAVDVVALLLGKIRFSITVMNINLTPESFVDIPDARKLLAWNIYLEAIKRVGATATTSVPTQHTKTDANMDEDSDIESDDSPSKDSELLLNNSDELAITSAADMLPSVSRRASSIRMKSIHDYEPIDNIRSLLVVKDRDNNTVLHHTALIGLQSSYNKLVTCGASPWLMNSKGQTAAGLLVGIKGHVNQFQLHRACLRHNFLDEDLTTAALRCPVDYDLPDELLRVWTLINDRRADDAIAYAGSLDTNNKIAVSDHYQIFVTLATFLAGYSEKTTLLKLSAYETYARSKLHDMSFYLHPVYFYVRYRLSMQTPPKGKIARNRAADGLSASKSFTKLSKRFLTVKDDIDDVVEAEIKDQNKFDEDSDENDDVELEDEEFTPDAPELEWLEVKKEVGKSSPSMDKLMALTGLKEVKKKAMAVYKEVLLTPLRPKYLDSRTTMNFLFVGNPGTGK
eukprot:gene13532-28695_t